jgi:hypothetical protein
MGGIISDNAKKVFIIGFANDQSGLITHIGSAEQ